MNALSLAAKWPWLLAPATESAVPARWRLPRQGPWSWPPTSISPGAAETEQLIKNAGYAGVAAVADVTDEEAMIAVVDDIVRTHGRLDIVHANAGVLWPEPP